MCFWSEMIYGSVHFYMKSWLWLLVAVFTCVVTFTYRHLILLPWESYYSADVEHGPLKAQMGDLYPRWIGTRELLLNKRNPYGPEVSNEIQTAFYGHPLNQNYDNPQTKLLDEQRFAYPVYVVFLLAPTVDLTFDTVQVWAPFAFCGIAALTAWLWLRVLDWRVSAKSTLAIILLVLSTPQITQAFRLRQVGVLVFFFLALASWCVIRDRLFLAGVLLAASTIKPQLVILCTIWFLLWSLGDFTARWRLPAGFGVTMFALIGGGELILPGWPYYFLEGVQAYRKYFPTTSPVRFVLGDWIGGALSILSVVLLVGYAWRRSHITSVSAEFPELLSMFLLTSDLVLPVLTPFNQALLVLPVFILLRNWKDLPKYGRLAFTMILVWPVIVSTIFLTIGMDSHSEHRTPLLPSALVMLTPFVVCALMFLRRKPLEVKA